MGVFCLFVCLLLFFVVVFWEGGGGSASGNSDRFHGGKDFIVDGAVETGFKTQNNMQRKTLQFLQYFAWTSPPDCRGICNMRTPGTRHHNTKIG